MSVAAYLKQMDEKFEPATRMIRTPAYTPGYHTRIADGTEARPTRTTMDYALANLQSGEAWRVDRACDIIDAIVAAQVTDPNDKHYGIWGWFYEEPPAKMNPADWNWANFIGVRLAQVLIVHDAQLRPGTRAGARRALLLAATSISRRNNFPAKYKWAYNLTMPVIAFVVWHVIRLTADKRYKTNFPIFKIPVLGKIFYKAATYTNIAISSGVTCVAAGELLNRPGLLNYGRMRMAMVLALARNVGTFTEYNSPTYTRVAIQELERGTMLLRDGATREIVEQLRVIGWTIIAERFHPATGQMAGPNSRAYGDWLDPELSRYFADRTGADIPPRRCDDPRMDLCEDEGVDLPARIPCPPDLAPRFKKLPSDPYVLVTPFRTAPGGELIGTTWMTKDAALGTVNAGSGWHQLRPILAQWNTASDLAVVFRSRMLMNGRDFAPTGFWTTQKDNRALGAWCLRYNAGAFHFYFDKLPDDKLQTDDLRMRLSLRGIGVEASQLTDYSFSLHAGAWQAVVHLAPPTLNGKPLEIEHGRSGDTAYVDVVLHTGATQTIDLRNSELSIAFGVEIIRENDRPITSPVTGTSQGENRKRWQWGDLSLEAPVGKVPMTT